MSWPRRQFLRTFLGVALASGLSAEVRLSVQGTPAQAMPLFVSVLGLDSNETVRMLWEGESYSLYWVESAQAWRGIAPISIDCVARPAGGLQILRGEEKLIERSVTVKPRDYGFQYLTLPESTLAGYSNPRNKADDQAILDSMTKGEASPLWSGNFSSPCQAPETTGFGQRRLYNGWKKSWHKGLDLGGWEGQEVVAPAAARVVHRARGLVNGNTLVLSHGMGLFSVYLHLSGFECQVGDRVEKGQTIGYVGGTGGFAPHLHWEVRASGVPVHPKAFYQLPPDWR